MSTDPSSADFRKRTQAPRRESDRRLLESLRARLEFEHLIAEISATFINVPASEIDSQIDNGLRLFGKYMQADRCFIDQFSEDRSECRTTHMWSEQGIEYDEFLFSVVLSEHLPWYTQRMLSGEPLILDSTDELPEEAVRERQYAQNTGIQSSAIVALTIGQTVIGHFGLDMIRSQRSWSDDDVQRLRIVSEIFANALARKNTELRLEKSERKYRSLLEQANDGVVIYQGERFVECNDKALELIRRPREEVIGRTPWELSPPNQSDEEGSMEKAKRLMHEAADRGAAIFEWQGLRGDGTVWDVEVSLARIDLGGAEPVVLGLWRDITERKEAELRLRASEERFRAAFEHAPAAVVTLDQTGRFTSANRRMREMLGYSGEELLKLTFRDITHPDDQRLAGEVWRDLWSGAMRRASIEKRYLRKDGTLLWGSVMVTTFGGDAGLPRYGLAVIIDITDQKLAQRALDVRLRYEQFVAHTSAAFVNIAANDVDRVIKAGLGQIGELFDADRVSLGEVSAQGSHIMATHAWLSEQHQTRSDIDAYRDPDGYPHIAATLNRGEPLLFTALDDLPQDWTQERRYVQALGIKAAVVVPLRIGGRYLGLLAIDSFRAEHSWGAEIVSQLTVIGEIFGNALQRKRADEALRTNQDELRELTGRLLFAQEEERRRLARELHDDLTQRLAVLAIEAGQLEQRAEGLDASALDRLGQMREQLVTLSADVHAFSRQLHPSILDDLGLVDALGAECEAFSEREGVTIEYHSHAITRDMPRDVALTVYRVAQEALRNIGKHAKVDNARVLLRQVNDHVRLQVEDSGVGFDTEQAHHRAGLGLQSIQERVRLVDGALAIETQPGRGTRIEVSMPLRSNAK